MTSIRHRLLIDECLPRKLISSYLHNHINLSNDGVSAVHITEHLGSGKKDSAWVPKIAGDRRWCVLSVDKGSHSQRRDALPIVCAEAEITLIRLSPSLVRRTLTFYGPQILANWPLLVQAMQGPKGAQYLLRLHASSHSANTLDRTILDATKIPSGCRLENGIVVEDAA